jgi:EAL domain-containing protein (putative c-di-GMP-specific phosphodiesterase class I)
VILPIAERDDLRHDLDRWVLTTALREASGWPESGRRSVAITVSIGALMPDSPDFLDEIADIIAASGIDHGRAVLELVETFPSDLPPRARTAMRWLLPQPLPPQRRHPTLRAGRLPVPGVS